MCDLCSDRLNDSPGCRMKFSVHLKPLRRFEKRGFVWALAKPLRSFEARVCVCVCSDLINYSPGYKRKRSVQSDPSVMCDNDRVYFPNTSENIEVPLELLTKSSFPAQYVLIHQTNYFSTMVEVIKNSPERLRLLKSSLGTIPDVRLETDFIAFGRWGTSCSR